MMPIANIRMTEMRRYNPPPFFFLKMIISVVSFRRQYYKKLQKTKLEIREKQPLYMKFYECNFIFYNRPPGGGLLFK